MANTGNLITLTLVSVRTDITDPTNPYYQEQLDINSVPVRLSGLTAYSKANVNTDPNYIAPYQNLTECPLPTTTTTTTTTTTSTTTTTTTEPPYFALVQNEGITYSSSSAACSVSTGGPLIYMDNTSPVISIGRAIYSDSGLTTTFIGNPSVWYGLTSVYSAGSYRVAVQINASGIVQTVVNC